MTLKDLREEIDRLHPEEDIRVTVEGHTEIEVSLLHHDNGETTLELGIKALGIRH